MQQLKTFFGQIIRKIDLDFLNYGNRQAINQTHIDLTNQLGGVIAGMEVYASANGLSLFINKGSFYNGGDFNPTNGSGGGEKGVIYVPQSFTTLTPTTIVGGNQTYLLVYAKTISQNSDPNPNSPQIVYSAKNIQTGENQPVRDYTAGVIVVSNPIARSEVSNFAGIPLALVQTDNNGKIVLIDTSVRRNYTLGGAVDVSTQKLVATAVPDAFLTQRMFADGQITGDKFVDGSITSPKIAVWDGSSSNYAFSGTVPGSGVGTDHLKDNAVTQAKLNYSGSTANLSTRNRLINSSFEFSPADLTAWTVQSGTTFSSNVSINNNQLFNQFGFQSAKLTGGFSSSALSVGIEQTVDFEDNLKGKPVSAFVYVKPLNGFNLAVSGTTGIKAQLDFISNSNAVVKTVEFAGYSGSSTDWQKLTTSEPIISDVDARLVKLSVFGAYDNTVYVDGAFLGNTDLIPGWDVSIDEQISNQLDASAIVSGQFPGDRIASGAILTRHVRNADGSVNGDTGNGIVNEQLRDGTITGAKIANGTVTAANLSPSLLVVPPGAIIMWDDTVSVGCPSGYSDVTNKFAGRFPLGFNTGAGTAIPNPGQASTTKAVGNTSQDGRLGVSTVNESSHVHGVNIGGGDVGGGGTSRAFPGNYTTGAGTPHNHEEVIPYYTVRFCQKT